MLGLQMRSDNIDNTTLKVRAIWMGEVDMICMRMNKR